ncbi:MAG: TPM domain-containing protein [Ferruginibacter sp.]
MNASFKIFFSVLLFVLATSVAAQQIPSRPVPPRLVNDYTNTLTPDQNQNIESNLVQFSDSTTTQIAVVIVETTGDYDISEYALKLGREWGVGGKEFNNGVILLIAKKDHRLHIATGYGVEGALPDITAKHIIEDVITPNFKGDDYYRGIYMGTDAIMKAVRGEYTAPATAKSRKSSGFPFIILFIIIFLLMSGGGRGGKGGQFMSRRGSRGLAGPLIWGSLLGGGGGGGSSWGGGGSSGGGGFGGFGGGSFGGGGASGSW